MSKGQPPIWVVAIGIAGGVLFAAAVGMYSFLSALRTPLHPNPAELASVRGVSPPPALADTVERARQRAREGLLETNLPGLSGAVGVDGEIVWTEGFGWADVDERVPVSPGMRFRIGHVSKTLTSAAVGVLLEQERLDLDAKIQSYVSGFPRQQWPITLRQLMGHVAGVRHYDSEADYMPSSHCERASDALPSFAADPLLFEPETRYRYSTYGWILVSAAVETAAREPFSVFMRREVFAPLGMNHTTFDAANDAASNRVTFYSPRFSGDPSTGPERAQPVDYSCLAGAGAILSTPSDLVRFGLALSTGRFLKRHTVAKLQMPQLLASGEETEYGLGWMLQTVPLGGEPTREAGHASLTLLGGSTSFLTFPDRGVVVAVTSNISRANTRSIALSIADVFARR